MSSQLFNLYIQEEKELYEKHLKTLQDLYANLGERFHRFNVSGSWSSKIEKIAMLDFENDLKSKGIYFEKQYDADDEPDDGKYFCHPSYTYLFKKN